MEALVAEGLTFREGRISAVLRPYVTEFVAYRESYATPLHRRRPPFGGIVMIFGFTERMGLVDPRKPDSPQRLASFVGGLADVYTDTTTVGRAEGIQVNLTPIGARLLFGMPMSELANQLVSIEDVLGRWGPETIARLAGLPRWADRLTLLDDLLTRRLLDADHLGPQIPWAWDRLVNTRGTVRIAELADKLGWSHRHLVARFHDEVGLAPKATARILRFEHALRHLEAGPSLADVAVRCGYYDQAHMNRDFRTMAGESPTRLIASRRAEALAIPESARA
jgi:AraC-like DNA-binding protein